MVKKAKSFPVAPIVTKILISRGSAYKIVVDSGTNTDKKAKIFPLQNNNNGTQILALMLSQ